ncbi:MAG: type IV pilus assembly protein PilM [Elusimicrobiota bacterium]
MKVKIPFLNNQDLFGLDIGAMNVKLVKLKNIGDEFIVTNVDIEPVVDDISKEIVPLEKQNLVVSAVKRLCSRNKLGTKRVVTSISGSSVIVRFVKFPAMTKEELIDSIRFEAEPYIPFDINEVELAFEITGQCAEEGQQKMDTVLVAAKKNIIDENVEILQMSGLRPVMINIDAFALEKVSGLSDTLRNETIMYVNIGAVNTTMLILENGISKVVRDIAIGGKEFTNALSHTSGKTNLESERDKLAQSILPEQPEINEEAQVSDKRTVLLGVAKDILDEIQRSINYFQAQTGEINVSKIFLTGGSASLKGLDAYFSSELDIPVSVFNPFDYVSIKEGIDTKKLEEIGPMFAVAVGLAMQLEKVK